MIEQNKLAIVTGAGQGIGAAIVESLVLENFVVVVADINISTASNLSAKMKEKHNAEIIPVELDLSSKSSIKKTVDHITSKYDYIDFIVNSARPYLVQKKFPDSVEDMEFSHKVMLEGPALLISMVLPYMQSSRLPSIVNISSTNSFLSSMQPLSYHIYKAALDQLTRHLSYELGELGIRVNSVSPGLVHKKDYQYSDKESRIRNAIVPLKRVPTESDISNMVVFLLSEKAKSMTGQIIIIDGGMTNVDQHNCAHLLLREE